MREMRMILFLALGAGFLGSILHATITGLLHQPPRQESSETISLPRSESINVLRDQPQKKSTLSKRGGKIRQRPIVFVVSDDLRATSIDAQTTPALWRFGESAIEFRRAYCQAPACNPSRNSFLTGLMPDVSKVYAFEATTEETLGARGAATFFSEFRKLGYRSYGVGKLFHWAPFGEAFSRNLPDGTRFQYWPRDYNQEWGYEGSNANDQKRSKPARCFNPKGQCHLRNALFLPEDDPDLTTIFDERVADIAVDLFQKLSSSSQMLDENGIKPFILGVGFHHPHLVWLIPPKFANLSYPQPEKPPVIYASDLVKTSPYFAFGDVALGTGIELELRDGKVVTQFAERHPPMPNLKIDAAIEMRASYRSAVRLVDEQFGKLINAIEQSSIDDDTIVIFTADHGYGLGERFGHWGKSALYEISTRVPLYIRDKRLNADRFSMPGRRVVKNPVELVDIFKTLIDLASPSYDPFLYKHLDGASLRKLMKQTRPGINPTDNGEYGFDKSIAITMMPKCPKAAWSIPFGCGGKSMSWTSDALVGFAARSANFRYVAWMEHNHSLDAVDWSRLPIAEELYDHRNVNPNDPDVWELVNLLAPPEILSSSHLVRSYFQRSGLSNTEIRDIANTHLRLLRKRARDRMTNAHGVYPFRFHNEKFPRHSTLYSGYIEHESTDLYPSSSTIRQSTSSSIFASDFARYNYNP